MSSNIGGPDRAQPPPELIVCVGIIAFEIDEIRGDHVRADLPSR